jgi:short subunit fatty acids transporter
MYKLSRLMLILSVVAGLWSLLIFLMQMGGPGLHRNRRLC